MIFASKYFEIGSVNVIDRILAITYVEFSKKFKNMWMLMGKLEDMSIQTPKINVFHFYPSHIFHFLETSDIKINWIFYYSLQYVLTVLLQLYLLLYFRWTSFVFYIIYNELIFKVNRTFIHLDIYIIFTFSIIFNLSHQNKYDFWIPL